MKIILQAELPDGWARETDPNGKIIYHNTVDDEFVFEHPMHVFFRKTFNRILNSEFDKTHEKVVENLVLDEVSKLSIDKLKQKKIVQIQKIKQSKKHQMKRRIVLGSSAAAAILNEDIIKLNKFKCEEGHKLVDIPNRSTQRFLNIHTTIKKRNGPEFLAFAKSENLVFSKVYNENTESNVINSMSFLKRIFGEDLNELFDNPKCNKYVKKLIPGITSDEIQYVKNLFYEE